MPINVSSKKGVSFRSPYTGKTFQDLTQHVLGASGYLSGGAVSDNGTLITVQPIKFVQNGIVAETTVAGTSLAVPTAAEPWYLLASVSDDDPNTGVTFTATANKQLAADGLVVGFKSGGRWRNPASVDVAEARRRKSTPGLENGFGIRDVRDGTGAVTGVSVFRGELTDADGNKIDLPHRVGNGTEAAIITPARPHPTMDRNDHVVLRHRGDGSSAVEYIVGGTVGSVLSPVVLQSSANATTPTHFAVRNGSIQDQWWVWGDGVSKIRLKIGTGAAADLATVLATEVWLVGQRASDGAIILLYVSGGNLSVLSFDEATGAIVDAAVAIDDQANAVSHASGMIDPTGVMNVVFQAADSPTQVYHSRVSIETANFGARLKTPRIITQTGASSTNHDTWPSMGVDSLGRMTISNTQGTGSNEFGEIVVTKLDEMGNWVSREVIYAATDVGVDPDIYNHRGGGTVSALSFTSLAKSKVTVSAHDEAYVFAMGRSGATLYNDYALVHGAGFDSSFGYKFINIDAPLTVVTDRYLALSATSGPQGEVSCVFQKSTATNDQETIIRTLDLSLIENGRWNVGSLIQAGKAADGTDGTLNERISLSQGVLGEVMLTYRWGVDATYSAVAPIANEHSGHSRDVYLGGWAVPAAASTTVDGRGKKFHTFSTRPKKMNYPFLVGDEGDYQGYGSLATAISAAARGGQIVVRPGTYTIGTKITLTGGISIRGEGRAVLIGSIKCTPGSAGTPTATGSLVESTGLSRIAPGDILEFATSGYHTVVRNLGWQASASMNHIVVDGTPADAFVQAYSAGNAIENLTIIAELNPAYLVELDRCYAPTVRNVRFEGVASSGLLGIVDCVDPLIDSVDLSAANADPNHAIEVIGGSGAIFRNLKFADLSGSLYIANDSQNAHILGCRSDNADASKVVYDIQAGRSTPVYMTSCEGRASGDLAYLISNMGRRLRAVEGIGALELEDDNTRDSAIGDDGIKLSSATHKEFNGATNDVITDAVNERVLRAGDTLTGPLVFAAGDERVLRGGDTMTGALLPNASGLGMGGVSNRWNLFAELAKVDNAGGVSTDDVVDIKGHSDQLGNLVNITGLGSNRHWGINAFGVPYYRGLHFIDDFINKTFDAGGSDDNHVWNYASAGGGSTGTISPTTHDLKLRVNGAALDHVTLTGRKVRYTRASRPGFMVRFKYDGDTDSILTLGFGNLSAYLIGTDLNIRWVDSVGAAFTIGIGTSLPAATYVYVAAQVITDSRILWSFSTTADRAGTLSGFVDLSGGTGILAGTDYVTVLSNLLAGTTDSTAEIDVIETWASGR